MKRNSLFAVVLALALSALLLAGCGKSEFGVTQNDPDRIVISAENAEKDAFFVTGSLEVAEGEQIVASAAELEKGSIRVEIYAAPENVESVSELTELGDAILTGNLGVNESVSGTVDAGSYLVKAICLEKATGTVEVTVQPAE